MDVECTSFCNYTDPACSTGNDCLLPGDWDCQWGNNTPLETFDIFFGSDCIETEIHMFMDACWSDVAVGGVCLLIAFVLMFVSENG